MIRYRFLIACGLAFLSLFMLGQQGCPAMPPVDNGGDDNGGTDGTGNSGITGQYAGSSTCETCHIQIQHNWEETLHAEALKTLEDIGQGTNTNCIGCHVVGFGESGGFVDRATTNDLAGVGCESCHGPSKAHVQNVADTSKRPPVNIASSVCGTCHTGTHHPHIEDWQSSGHSEVTSAAASYFESGILLSSCGPCHSGDYFYKSTILEETVSDDLLAGTDPSDMHAQECAICHDPHAQTGNAPTPEDDRDFQLRFPEVAYPTATNTVSAATDASRFNLCGQCHHSRGRTWEATSRGPHHSIQVNMYTGEMPIPSTGSTLVASRVSAHARTDEQCATCHMYRQDFESEVAPAISGHKFSVNTTSCGTSGCHPSETQALAAQATLQSTTQTDLDSIASRLGDPSTWEYEAEGGPDETGQDALSDEIKQVRFLYHYVLSDASLGIHNPDYVRDILSKADEILTSIGL